MKYYLIGKNIQTSLSPRIHNYLFKIKDRPQTYQPAVSGKLFSLQEMQHQSFGGTSITIPFKKDYSLQPCIIKEGTLSEKYGVINTIFKDKQRKLRATNTDIFGIEQCFGNKWKQVEYQNALVIGAGATAEIFCSYFQNKKIQTSLINRSQPRMNELKSVFKSIVDFFPLKQQFYVSKTNLLYSVIVNTLPSEVVYDNWTHIEKHLQALFSSYPKSRTKLLYFNVNYRHKLDPIEELLIDSLKLSIQSLKGLDMLLWQAIQQNRYFCDNSQQLHQEQYLWQMNKLKQELHL